MKNRRLPLLVLLTASALTALSLSAARLSDDALALVPTDSASVGMVRLADLRSSPLSAELFRECDHLTVDGDAQRFMEDARLNAKEDVDVVVVAGSRKGPHSGSGLVIFEGRFDPTRLGSALASRNAVKKSSAHGDYFLLPDHKSDGSVDAGHSDGAIALVSKALIVAGTEDAVVRALSDRASGGSGFASGTGLGRHLSRIDSGATAWALVDTTRFPEMKEKASRIHMDGDINGHPIAGIFGAMQSVSLISIQATVKGDGVKLEAAGVTQDAETRELLEDTLKGALAAMRLAMQEKSPDTVSVIRRFKVTSDRDSVSISGTLPGPAVRAMMEKKAAEKRSAEKRASND